MPLRDPFRITCLSDGSEQSGALVTRAYNGIRLGMSRIVAVAVIADSHAVVVTRSRCERRDHVQMTRNCPRRPPSVRPYVLYITVMDVDPTSPMSSQSYTILRIKRKRNEEPLDALGKISVRLSYVPNE